MSANYEEVLTLLVAVKGKFGVEVAKKLIADFGKSTKAADIDPSNYDAVIKECDRVMLLAEEADVYGAKKVAANLAQPEASPTQPHELDMDAKEAACEALSALPGTPTISDALNAIYRAWLSGGFMLPMSVKTDAPAAPAEEDY